MNFEPFEKVKTIFWDPAFPGFFPRVGEIQPHPKHICAVGRTTTFSLHDQLKKLSSCYHPTST